MDRIRIEELATDARDLLSHPAFVRLISALEQDSLAVLRTTPLGDLTAQLAHARIRLIEEMKAHLTSLINDEKVASRQPRKHPIG